jgi:hypothetical protein
MVRTSQPPQPFRRRGAVLLVVITLLVLFAAVALAFVYYASSQATASRYGREAQTAFRPDVEPELLLSYFLGKLIYGDADDATGVYSALRGHDLARLVYDWNDAAFSTTAFNGLGRPHTGGAANPFLNPFGKDDFFLPNYTYFPADNFLRDPGRQAARQNLAQPRGPFVGGANATYTYPDLNNLCLAAVNANGEVLLPSFHRPWTGIGPLDPANPNWGPGALAANPWLKYATARPLPAYHNLPGKSGLPFPPPVSGGGDVKNLEGCPGVPVPGQPGAYYNEDSVWLDVGFPVLTAPDGTKYKPLFAALVVDLDGKVNVNACGNVRGANKAHVSDQGWGAWEVSLARAMTQGKQWPNLFTGNGTIIGRYGKDGQPGAAGSAATAGPAPRFYAAVDLDATSAPNYAPPQKVYLPGAAANPNAPYVAFPYFPPTTYTNGDLYERTNHPLLYNPVTPGADDRAFSAREMEAILRYTGTGTPALNSDLFGLCPLDIGFSRTRLLLTTHSFDLNRPGAMPWLYGGAAPYQLIPGDTTPQGPAVGSPQPPVAGAGEFEPAAAPAALARRAATAALGRVNLNQPLPDYPAVDPTARQIQDLAGFARAQQARQALARDLFNRLCWVTTGQPTPGAPALQALKANAPTRYNALRWLAQLAVNIVDYVDSDDYSTPFNWDPSDPASGWVYGVELPRLVINEAYAELDNDPADLGTARATNPYQLNFWAELHNPFLPDPNLKDPLSNPADPTLYGAARLRVPAADGSSLYSAYRLVIAQAPQPGLLSPANPRGDVTANVKLVVQDFVPDPNFPPAVNTDLVLATSGAYAGPDAANQGFYVLGPKAEFPGTNPGRPHATLRVKDQALTDPMTGNAVRSSMTYEVPAGAMPGNHTLVLQRLACPSLPPQGDPTDPAGVGYYNPYVTVDYVDNVPVYDGLQVDPQGKHVPTPFPLRQALGRRQPYAAASVGQQVLQTPDADNDPSNGIKGYFDQPQHTFFRHNGVGATPPGKVSPYGSLETLAIPFDWLTHLDRPLVNPAELLTVSACAPPQLTQLFMTPRGPFGHLAPWRRTGARLYRFLEFVETASLTPGVEQGGRLPGKINLNTVWDPEVLDALTDPQPASYFPASVTTAQLFRQVIKSRSPDLIDPATGQVGAGRALTSGNDRPFLALSAGFVPPGDAQWPRGTDINDTVLRGDPDVPSKLLFGVASPRHVYLRAELLRKVLGNVTTRSNVYAVWLTVGFFEVTDETARPVKLGAEIGKEQGRNVRHRMFAVIDRSNLAVPSLLTTLAQGVAAGPAPQPVAVGAVSGTATAPPPVGVSLRWALQPGVQVVVGAGTANQETVTLTAVAPGTVTAAFAGNHAAGETVTIPGTPGPLPNTVLGNPGPQARYDPRANGAAVLHFNIVE